jgi:hypothetical protein
VLETGETFGSGEFVANLEFQGVPNEEVCNFTGIVKICQDRAQLNDTTCTRSLFAFEEFEWDEDCSDTKINYTGEGGEWIGVENPLHEWEYTVYEDGVEMCIWIPPFILEDPVEAYISFILLLISLTCLFITLVTYCLFSELRNLPGLNLMALAATTFAYQLIFISLVNLETMYKRTLCKTVAVSEHFLILASFMWTNVMAWDIYKTFGKKTIFTRVRPKRYFIRYFFYAYGVTFVIMRWNFQSQLLVIEE